MNTNRRRRLVKTTRATNKKKGSNRKPESAVVQLANFQPRIPRGFRSVSPIPLAEIRKLRFTLPEVVLQAAAKFALITVKANDVYSPNAGFLTAGTVPFFDMMSLGYNKFRVEKVSFRFIVTSNEPAIPLDFFMGLSDQLPTPATYAEAQNLVNRPVSTEIYSVGQTTGMSRYMSNWRTLRLSDVIGDPSTFLGDEGYIGVAGSVPASPAQLVYLYFVLLSNTGINLTNGAFVTIEYVYHTKFFSIVSDPTPSPIGTDYNNPRYLLPKKSLSEINNSRIVSLEKQMSKLDCLEKRLDKADASYNNF